MADHQPLLRKNTSRFQPYYGSLDGVDKGIWSEMAEQHLTNIDINAPDIQDLFDVTDYRLQGLYDAFDRDYDGKLTKAELLSGLDQQGFHLAEGTGTIEAFETLWSKCDKDTLTTADGKVEECITFHSFKQIIQRLKIEVLFLPKVVHGSYHASYISDGPSRPGTPLNAPQGGGEMEPTSTGYLSYVDYNQRKFLAEAPVKDPYAFFVAHRLPGAFTMRWVHQEGVDRLNVLRLATKYSLHPLAVEDALKLAQQQPKVNKYGNHLVIFFPFFRLATGTRIVMDRINRLRKEGKFQDIVRGDSKKPQLHRALSFLTEDPLQSLTFDVEVESSKLAIFAAGPPNYDTLITMHTAFQNFNEVVTPIRPPESDTSSTDGDRAPELRLRMSDYDDLHHVRHHMMTREYHCFHNTINMLKVEYSLLRQGNSNWLLHKVLDEIVDNLQPITRAYRMRLRIFTEILQHQRANFKPEQVREVLDIKGDLQRLQRRIRPMTTVVRHLIDDPQIGPDVKVYLHDVLEHIVRCLEELASNIELCDGFKEEAHSYREQRTSQVLYVLAIVTSIFVPLQFISSVEGMNFVRPDGTPNMPELNWKYGYIGFWVLSLVVAAGLVGYFRYVKRWL